ncbi:MAG: hypothetical protein SOR72_03930 [Hornefia sp.]|nr:hypothetical protein [Hornefia sp.]
MNKKEMLKKAYINAVENMIIAGLDNDTCYIVIRESMKLYLMGHNVECTEREVVEFIKEQVAVLKSAVTDYENPFNN